MDVTNYMHVTPPEYDCTSSDIINAGRLHRYTIPRQGLQNVVD